MDVPVLRVKPAVFDPASGPTVSRLVDTLSAAAHHWPRTNLIKQLEALPKPG